MRSEGQGGKITEGLRGHHKDSDSYTLPDTKLLERFFSLQLVESLFTKGAIYKGVSGGEPRELVH